MPRLKLVAGVLVCLGILSGFWGCQTTAARNMGRAITDDAITAEVKARLMDDPAADGLKVGVHTYAKVVTLTGRANTSEQKDRAVQIARSADGVLGVSDQIEVGR